MNDSADLNRATPDSSTCFSASRIEREALYFAALPAAHVEPWANYAGHPQLQGPRKSRPDLLSPPA